jgi:ribosomal protein L32
VSAIARAIMRGRRADGKRAPRRHGWQHVAAMERVCPFCGEPPGAGVFCAACGRNLSAIVRLPSRGEWEAGAGDAAEPAAAGPPAAAMPADDRPVAERCAAATAAFLAAMRAAGCPGTTRTRRKKTALFQRAGRAEGWVVRPVERDDESSPRRYEPGLVLTTDGDWYQLDNVLRGYGTRDFPQYEHSVGAEPIAPPADERLADELAAVLREQGVRTP